MQETVRIFPLSSLTPELLGRRRDWVRIVFLRHAEGKHQHLFSKLIYFLNFAKDPHLTLQGIAQCQQYPLQWLLKQKNLKVVSSPLSRCKETAQYLGLEIDRIEPLVREISGSSEDRYRNVSDPFLWADTGIFSYESEEHGLYRAALFLHHVCKDKEKKIFFIISHKWFICLIKKYLQSYFPGSDARNWVPL